MKKTKNTPRPVHIGKALSFNEMVNEVMDGAKRNEVKWLNDHLCTADGCSNPSAHDICFGTHLCDNCKKETDRLLKELGH